MFGIVEVLVGAEEEVFESDGCMGWIGTCLEAFPADRNGGVDTDEDEEGAAEKSV